MNRKTYSIVDMVVLSILLKEPMNAYRLAQFVEKNQITRLVKLSTPAIYKSCKRLFEQGNLSGEAKRDGEAPEKMMYKVTAAGRQHFEQLMAHFAGAITPFYFDINSVVFSLEQLDFDQGLALIDTYAAAINATQSWLIPHSQEPQAKATFGNRMIIEQYLMMVNVLVEWVQHLREEFIKERG
ncbi:MAG: PadR family transcriptional regulator [Xanthomonadales bacterium]|nr:PadR family transcriptional regulator [Xanthomonadales bacterium]